jgi:poly-gamma-glutamate synthase PgsB/CapB
VALDGIGTLARQAARSPETPDRALHVAIDPDLRRALEASERTIELAQRGDVEAGLILPEVDDGDEFALALGDGDRTTEPGQHKTEERDGEQGARERSRCRMPPRTVGGSRHHGVHALAPHARPATDRSPNGTEPREYPPNPSGTHDRGPGDRGRGATYPRTMGTWGTWGGWGGAHDGGAAELVRLVLDDLTSRSALSGAASLVISVALTATWWRWTSAVRRRTRAVPVRILVTGTRGKSSTTRLIHAVLMAAGRAAFAKTTGSAAAELAIDGTERETPRRGSPSVVEVLRVLDRAVDRSDPPDALVLECMAIRPDLIELIADEMLEPNIVVVTNVGIDHLEEEGSDIVEIAGSFATAIGPDRIVVTAETDPRALGVLRERAAATGARLVPVSDTDVPAALRERLPNVHPDNLAMVLAVARELGIDEGTAVAGMGRVTVDPGDIEVWRRSIDGLELTYADLGAINDPGSLLEALDAFDWPLPRDVPRVALVTSRWDRPLRALSFVGPLARMPFDAFIVTGHPRAAVRRALIAHGRPPQRVVTGGRIGRSPDGAARTLHRLAPTQSTEASRLMVVALQNLHDPVADGWRAFFRGGERLDLPNRSATP